MKHKIIVVFEIEAPTRTQALDALAGAIVDSQLDEAIRDYPQCDYLGSDLDPQLFSEN